jgi:TonB family protein
MIEPRRILDAGGPDDADPRAGLKRALLGAARREAAPPEAREELLDALGLGGVAARAPAPDLRRARAAEWQPRPLFSSVLAREGGDPWRLAAGALACAAAFALVILGGARDVEQPVGEPRARVELRAAPRGVAGPRVAESEPPPVAVEAAPEARVVPAGKGDRPVREQASGAPAAPAAPAGVAPSEPVATVPAPTAEGRPVAAEIAAAAAPPVPSSEVLPFGEGMSPPRLLEGPEPAYPREAREARVQGTMLVRCVITTTGTLQGCRVLQSLPYLEQPVLEALAHRRYTPVLYQGRAVNVAYVIPLRFELH